MEITKFFIEGVILFKPRVFKDSRGHFFEAFNQQVFNDNVEEQFDFVQDNQSLSQKNTLRGLHFQKPPHAQGKLVSVVQGAVVDIVVDIRKDSLTYGKSLEVKLTANEAAFLWVPPGFAHGFYTTEENTIFQYKCTNYYNKESEGSIFWKDSNFDFSKRIIDPIVSEKDAIAPHFTNFKSPF